MVSHPSLNHPSEQRPLAGGPGSAAMDGAPGVLRQDYWRVRVPVKVVEEELTVEQGLGLMLR